MLIQTTVSNASNTIVGRNPLQFSPCGFQVIYTMLHSVILIKKLIFINNRHNFCRKIIIACYNVRPLLSGQTD